MKEFIIDGTVLKEYKGNENIVEVPEGITEIAERAFYNNQYLMEIILPDTITKIGNSAFEECPYLETVYLPEHITVISKKMFKDCIHLKSIYIPEGVTEIQEKAFEGCISLRKVYLPDTLKVIDKAAFLLCDFLQVINFPASLLRIEDEAFCGCSLLERITLEDGLQVIGRDAFQACYSLQTVVLPESTYLIGIHAFKDCRNIEEVDVPEKHYSDFKNTKWFNDNFTDRDGFTIYNGVLYRYTGKASKLYLSEGLRVIDEYVFKDNKTITEVILPETIEWIGGQAFENCTSLKSITLPDQDMNILTNAFNGCTSLVKVHVPDKYAHCFLETPWFLNQYTDEHGFVIHNHVLYKYIGYADMILIPDTVTSVYYEAFDGIHNVCIVFPESFDSELSFSLPRDILTFYQAIPYLGIFDIEDKIKAYVKVKQAGIQINNKVIESYEHHIKKHINLYIDYHQDPDILSYILKNYKLSLRQYDAIGKIIFNYENTELNALYLSTRNKNYTQEQINTYRELQDKIMFGDYDEEVLKEIWIIEPLSEIEVSNYQKEDPLHYYQGTYKVVGYYGNQEDEVIPSTIDGKRITVVDLENGNIHFKSVILEEGIYYLKGGFLLNDYLEKIIVSDTVSIIGHSAFMSCETLKEIVLPDSLANIGSMAFYGCESLEKVTVPERFIECFEDTPWYKNR